ncbi:hypothetical protein BSKO_01405 [Bryopsis sp. KO-2023]|nr:hypothetical protein BSKO_01405 [Bryopsis sp. KO-2023]
MSKLLSFSHNKTSEGVGGRDAKSIRMGLPRCNLADSRSAWQPNAHLGRVLSHGEASVSRSHALNAVSSSDNQSPSLITKPSLTRAREIYGEEEAEEIVQSSPPVPTRNADQGSRRKYLRKGQWPPNEGLVVGQKKFYHLDELYQYYGAILARTMAGTRVQKQEQEMILDLLSLGHKDAREKIGAGVDHIFAGVHPDYDQKCFMIRRKDDTEIDFSYRKCIHNLVFNQWENAPPRIVQFRNEARSIRQSCHSGLKSQAMIKSVRERASQVAQEILKIVADTEHMCSSTALIATNGLSYCIQADMNLVMKVVKHPSYEYLIQIIQKSSRKLPAFLMVSQLACLSHLAPQNTSGAAAYDKLSRRILRIIDQLDTFDLVLLLQTLAQRGLPKGVAIEPILTLVHRQLELRERAFTLHQMNGLVRALCELNIYPNQLLRNSTIKPSHNSHDCFYATRILHRLAMMPSYPGEKLFNELVECVIKFEDVDVQCLTFVWMAVVRLKHKLPQDLQKELFKIADSRFDEMMAGDIACWIWGFGHQGIEPPMYDKWIAKVALGAVNQEFEMRKTTLCLWSMAVLRKYEMPEFRTLWSTINQIDLKEWDNGSLATIFQVSVAVEMECPSLRLKLSDLQYAAACEAWQGLVQRVTVSPLHRSVFAIVRRMGFKAVCEYVTERNLFSVDIALLPPGYIILDDKTETGDDVGETSVGPNGDLGGGSSTESFDDDSAEEDFENESSSAEDDKTLAEFVESVKHDLMDVDLMDNDEQGSDSSGEGRKKGPSSLKDLQGMFANSVAKWVSGAREDFMVHAMEMDDVRDLVDGEGTEEDSDRKDAQKAGSTELRVQKSTRISAPKDQIDLEAALEFDQLPLVAIEVDGPHHYFANEHTPLGRCIIRERLMKKLGWKVVHIPYSRWIGKSDSERESFLMSALERNIVNPESFLGGSSTTS